MSKPYNKGQTWYIKLDNGYEMEFVSDKEAIEFYELHKND